MDINCFTTQKEKQYAKACLVFAKQLGLIDDDSFEAVKTRCENENKKREEQLKNNEAVYGLTHFSLPAYLQYELTRYKLAFASEKEEIKKVYSYREISDEEKKAFFNENADLFTRYGGDSFSYGEVEMVIKKRIREAEYENEIGNILCKLADR
ncbi:MAG: hypothetical protein ACI4IQ_06370 [Eubacterium sp.]